jgi:dihydroneopterin aldolase
MSAPVIEILGLEVFAYHGVHDAERRNGQLFRFDVRLEAASAAAERSDDLADAVDYGAVAATVVELAQGGPYALLERLAAVIADDLLDRFGPAAVTVRVHKPQAPIPHAFDDVTVTVERRRGGVAPPPPRP